VRVRREESGAGCGERWQAHVPDGVLAVAPRATPHHVLRLTAPPLMTRRVE